MRHEVMMCAECGGMWLVSRDELDSFMAYWCRRCCASMGRIGEALRPHDTQPGPAGELFEAVMLDAMLGRATYAQACWLRLLLGLPLPPEPETVAA